MLRHPFVIRHSSLGISSFYVCPPIGVLHNQRERLLRGKTPRLLHRPISFCPAIAGVCEHHPVQNPQSFAKLAPSDLSKPQVGHKRIRSVGPPARRSALSYFFPIVKEHPPHQATGVIYTFRGRKSRAIFGHSDVLKTASEKREASRMTCR